MSPKIKRTYVSKYGIGDVVYYIYNDKIIKSLVSSVEMNHHGDGSTFFSYGFITGESLCSTPEDQVFESVKDIPIQNETRSSEAH